MAGHHFIGADLGILVDPGTVTFVPRGASVLDCYGPDWIDEWDQTDVERHLATRAAFHDYLEETDNA